MITLKEEETVIKEVGKATRSKKFNGYEGKIKDHGSAYYVINDNHVTTLRILGKADYHNIGTQKPGVIPESISKLRHLEVLGIWYVNVPELPSSIADLTELKEIRITGVPIKTLPESIGKLSNLKKIHISATHLEHLPDSFGNLTNLEDMYLNETKLEEIPKSFKNLTKLDSVHIKGKLTKIPSLIFNWVNCSRLSIHENPLNPEDHDLISLSKVHGAGGSLIRGAGMDYLRKELLKRYEEEHPDETIDFREEESLQEVDLATSKPDDAFLSQIMALNEHALMALAGEYAKLGNREREKVIWSRVLQIVPNLFNAKKRLLDLELQMGPPEEAERIITEILHNTNDVTAISYLGSLINVKIKLNKLREAADLLVQLTNRVPKDYFSWYNLGKVYIQLGNNEAAKLALGKCINLLGSDFNESNSYMEGINIKEVQELYDSL